MQDHSTIAAAEIAEHPEWCVGAWCEVHPRVMDYGTFADGHHFGGATAICSSHGWDLAAQLYAETSPHGEWSNDAAGVALRVAANTDLRGINRRNKWAEGETILLEPEEAELLARRLLEAAAEARNKLKLLMV